MARTGGLEPPFATPFTVHRFVAGAGYVRMIAETKVIEFLSASCRMDDQEIREEFQTEAEPAFALRATARQPSLASL